MVTSPKGLGPEKDYAGEGQQHIKIPFWIGMFTYRDFNIYFI
jgi:hypothetical protein